MHLRWRLVVVTGAGSGPRARDRAALRPGGCRVLVVDRDAAAAEETAALVRASRVRAWALQTDLCDADGPALVAARARDLGGADVLVNNAGGWTPGEQYPAASPDDWSPHARPQPAGADAAHPALPRRPRAPPRSHRRPCGRRQRRLERGARRRWLRLAGVRRREGRPRPLHHRDGRAGGRRPGPRHLRRARLGRPAPRRARVGRARPRRTPHPAGAHPARPGRPDRARPRRARAPPARSSSCGATRRCRGAARPDVTTATGGRVELRAPHRGARHAADRCGSGSG